MAYIPAAGRTVDRLRALSRRDVEFGDLAKSARFPLLDNVWQFDFARRAGCTIIEPSIGHTRVTVDQGDYVYPSDPDGPKVRGELGAVPQMTSSSEAWFYMQVLPPEDYFSDKWFDRWCIIQQFHQSAPAADRPGNPPINLAIDKISGDLLIVRYTQDSVDPTLGIYEVLEQVGWTKGAWHHVLMHVGFSRGDTGGFIRVWLDGTQIAAFGGVVGYPNDDSVQCKYGTYRGEPALPTSENGETIFEFARATFTMESLASYVTNPPPFPSA